MLVSNRSCERDEGTKKATPSGRPCFESLCASSSQPALLAARASRLAVREVSTIADRGPTGPRIAYQALPTRPVRTPRSAPVVCAVLVVKEMWKRLVIAVTPKRIFGRVTHGVTECKQLTQRIFT